MVLIKVYGVPPNGTTDMKNDTTNNEPAEVVTIFELVLNHAEAPLIIAILATAIVAWKALDIYKRR